jgi:hypothetical protein
MCEGAPDYKQHFCGGFSVEKLSHEEALELYDSYTRELEQGLFCNYWAVQEYVNALAAVFN